MIRPYTIINRYLDFPTPSTIFSFVANIPFVDTTGTSGQTRYVDYFLNYVNNNLLGTPSKIGTNGLVTGLTHSYQIDGYTNGNTIIVPFTRNINGVGRQQDQINFFRTDGVTTTQTDTGIFDFVTLQQAVPITVQRNPADNTIIGTLGSGVNINGSVGTTYRLDKSTNRGDQVSSVWVILKYDPVAGTTPITATPGSDYTLIAGTLSSDIIDIQFLSSSFNYRVQNIATGYTFSNNPYYDIAGDTSPNTQLNSNDFILNSTTITYQILFPQVDMTLSVASNVQIATNPLTTYQNQYVTIQGIILSSTGYYKQVNGSVITPITKIASDWLVEMNSLCNVVLNITDKVSGALYKTINGFGPYSIWLSNINKYNFTYITTLK